MNSFTQHSSVKEFKTRPLASDNIGLNTHVNSWDVFVCLFEVRSPDYGYRFLCFPLGVNVCKVSNGFSMNVMTPVNLVLSGIQMLSISRSSHQSRFYWLIRLYINVKIAQLAQQILKKSYFNGKVITCHLLMSCTMF